MKARLMSAAALALLFAVAGAQAQTDQSGGGQVLQGDKAGAAPEGGAGGVCPPEQCPREAAGQGPDSGMMPAEGAPAEGQAQGTDQPIPPEGQATGEAQPGVEEPADQAAGAEGQGGNQEEVEVQTGQQAKPDEPATTGSTDAVEIDEEKATAIRETLHEVHVDPVAEIDFEINIGIAVPSTVVLHPLPPRIVEIVPVYSGYQFFVLADGTIIIVDPGTLQIVYVLYA